MACHALAVCHAEVNALLNRNAKSVKGCTLYCNYSPCWDCAREMLHAGIAKVVYGQLCDKDHALGHMKEVTRHDGRYMPVLRYCKKDLLIDNYKIATVDMVFVGC